MPSQPQRIPVIVSGLPGSVGRALVDALSKADDLALVPTALTSARHAGTVHEQRGVSIDLIDAARFGEHAWPEGAVVVDFTVPEAVVPNVERYCARGVPFVLGTSGDTLQHAAALVRGSATSAVIAANMAIPVILLQAALSDLARRFPGAMAGGELAIVESHQVTKRDISGTARALLDDLAGLGLPADGSTIASIRDEARARAWGVPEPYLEGHAYHDIELRDASGTASLTLSTKVHGRAVYATGALTAVRFLAEAVASGARGEVYDMSDVLRRGARS